MRWSVWFGNLIQLSSNRARQWLYLPDLRDSECRAASQWHQALRAAKVCACASRQAATSSGRSTRQLYNRSRDPKAANANSCFTDSRPAGSLKSCLAFKPVLPSPEPARRSSYSSESRAVDPDPHSICGSRSRREKFEGKNWNNARKMEENGNFIIKY